MATPGTYKWDKKQILVVEDDESSAYLLGVILKETGAHVEYSSDGETAVDYIRDNPDTDLILMDVQLPEMDGLTATRKIKSIDDRIIVIAQTAYAFSMNHQEAQQAGCDDFMTKPLSPNLLLEKLSNYLD